LNLERCLSRFDRLATSCVRDVLMTLLSSTGYPEPAASVAMEIHSKQLDLMTLTRCLRR
jgi:hypothetical protein